MIWGYPYFWKHLNGFTHHYNLLSFVAIWKHPKEPSYQTRWFFIGMPNLREREKKKPQTNAFKKSTWNSICKMLCPAKLNWWLFQIWGGGEPKGEGVQMVINLAKNSNVGKPNQQIIFLSRHASVKKNTENWMIWRNLAAITYLLTYHLPLASHPLTSHPEPGWKHLFPGRR